MLFSSRVHSLFIGSDPQNWPRRGLVAHAPPRSLWVSLAAIASASSTASDPVLIVVSSPALWPNSPLHVLVGHALTQASLRPGHSRSPTGLAAALLPGRHPGLPWGLVGRTPQWVSSIALRPEIRGGLLVCDLTALTFSWHLRQCNTTGLFVASSSALHYWHRHGVVACPPPELLWGFVGHDFPWASSITLRQAHG